MKKVSKIFLKENADVLGKDEMKFILGGVYRCCCPEPWSNVPGFDRWTICAESGSSLEDARNTLSYMLFGDCEVHEQMCQR